MMGAMRCLLLLTLCCLLPALEARLFDGRLLVGAELIGGRVQAAGESFPLARCEWLATQADAPAEQPDLGLAPLGVLLRDGGYLPALDLRPGTRPDHLLVTGPLGSFEVPLTLVMAWGQRPLAVEGGAAPEQDRIALVNGQELFGEVRGLQRGGLAIATDLDDETLLIPLDQIRSLRLAVVLRPPTGLSLRLVHDPALPPLLLAAETPWHLLALPEASLQASLPLPRLTVLGGDAVGLSSLEPAAVEERGAFEVVWPWARDRQIDGGPIRLRGRLFERGIVLHSFAALDYALEGAYQRFQAQCGIVDSMGYEGDCLLRVFCDGEPRFEQRLRGAADPVGLDLDLSGVRRLRIEVAIGERFDIGDHVALADARLVRVPTAP
jgi:hypothetical protein